MEKKWLIEIGAGLLIVLLVFLVGVSSGTTFFKKDVSEQASISENAITGNAIRCGGGFNSRTCPNGYFCSINICQPVACLSAPAGLIGWWTGDNIVSTSRGPLNTSVAQNINFLPGMVGSSLNFSSSDFRIANTSILSSVPGFTANTSILSSVPGFTIDTWIKLNSLPSSRFTLDAPIIRNTYMNLSVNSTGFLKFYYRNTFVVSSSALTTNVWYHIAVTTRNNHILYINGAPRGTSALIPITNSRFVSDLSSLGEFPFMGQLDEFQIFNSELSSREIVSIYTRGSSGVCKP